MRLPAALAPETAGGAAFVLGWADLSLLTWFSGIVLSIMVDPVFLIPALYEPLSGWVRANEMLRDCAIDVGRGSAWRPVVD